MMQPLELYRRQVSEIPALDEGSFSDDLSRCRTGDDEAMRRISGPNLRIALEVAEEWALRHGTQPTLEVVESANGGLVRAIQSFAGSTVEEFSRFVRPAIREHLDHVFGSSKLDH